MDKKLKMVSCDPMCGFMAKDHDEKELVDMVKMHAKRTHHMDMTDKEVMDKMKDA